MGGIRFSVWRSDDPGRYDLQRCPAYGADITAGTNNEFGFDYLRDHGDAPGPVRAARPQNRGEVTRPVDEARPA
jgi:hypothetical protein